MPRALPPEQGRLVVDVQPIDQFRFRYGSESGRSNLLGEGQKPCPVVKVLGFAGEARLFASLVTVPETLGELAKPHPHMLEGDHTKDGVYSKAVNITPTEDTIDLKGIYLVSTPAKSYREALETRERLKFDPYQTGFDHKDRATSIDRNYVQICFQLKVMIPNIGWRILAPVCSRPILNTSKKGRLEILGLTPTCGPSVGEKRMILLMNGVNKKEDVVRVQFSDKERGWSATGNFKSKHLHETAGIMLVYPPYDLAFEGERRKVSVVLVTRRGSTRPVDFYYTKEYAAKRKERKVVLQPQDPAALVPAVVDGTSSSTVYFSGVSSSGSGSGFQAQQPSIPNLQPIDSDNDAAAFVPAVVDRSSSSRVCFSGVSSSGSGSGFQAHQPSLPHPQPINSDNREQHNQPQHSVTDIRTQAAAASSLHSNAPQQPGNATTLFRAAYQPVQLPSTSTQYRDAEMAESSPSSPQQTPFSDSSNTHQLPQGVHTQSLSQYSQQASHNPASTSQYQPTQHKPTPRPRVSSTTQHSEILGGVLTKPIVQASVTQSSTAPHNVLQSRKIVQTNNQPVAVNSQNNQLFVDNSQKSQPFAGNLQTQQTSGPVETIVVTQDLLEQIRQATAPTNSTVPPTIWLTEAEAMETGDDLDLDQIANALFANAPGSSANIDSAPMSSSIQPALQQGLSSSVATGNQVYTSAGNQPQVGCNTSPTFSQPTSLSKSGYVFDTNIQQSANRNPGCNHLTNQQVLSSRPQSNRDYRPIPARRATWQQTTSNDTAAMTPQEAWQTVPKSTYQSGLFSDASHSPSHPLPNTVYDNVPSSTATPNQSTVVSNTTYQDITFSQSQAVPNTANTAYQNAFNQPQAVLNTNYQDAVPHANLSLNQFATGTFVQSNTSPQFSNPALQASNSSQQDHKSRIAAGIMLPQRVVRRPSEPTWRESPQIRDSVSTNPSPQSAGSGDLSQGSHSSEYLSQDRRSSENLSQGSHRSGYLSQDRRSSENLSQGSHSSGDLSQSGHGSVDLSQTDQADTEAGLPSNPDSYLNDVMDVIQDDYPAMSISDSSSQ